MSNRVVEAIETAPTVGETGISNEAISAAVSKAKVAKAERLEKALAKVFEQADAITQSLVTDLRRIRKSESKIRERLKDLVRAVEYAKETGNIAPLSNEQYHTVSEALQLAGVTDLTETDFQVPKDWNPADDSRIIN